MLMGTTEIVKLLIEERDKLDAAIRALQSTPDDSSMPDWVRPVAQETPSINKGVSLTAGPQKTRKPWTEAQKKAIGARTKAMWAAKRKEAANKPT